MYLVANVGGAAVGKFIDLTGQKFGRLLVIERCGYSSDRHITWTCKCDCGNTKEIIGKCIKSGAIRSCGCISREKSKTLNLSHGMSNTKEYTTWVSMINRCYDKNRESWIHYGGRGIIVCDSWRNFENFYEDMGDRPEGTTLDRINVNGNYCKENCRWATILEQSNNKRWNRYYVFNGEKLTKAELSRTTGISYGSLRHYLDTVGISVEEVLKIKGKMGI